MCWGGKWAISQRKWWHLVQGLESEYEKPGLAETWRKLTGTGVGRCRSSTWPPIQDNSAVLLHAGSPGPVTCWHLTFKCTKSDASSFWPSVIPMDSFSAFLSSAPGSHTVCVITAGFCLCAIPADSGAAYKPACVKVQCFTFYVDTEICISVCFDHVKACQFPSASLEVPQTPPAYALLAFEITKLFLVFWQKLIFQFWQSREI